MKHTFIMIEKKASLFVNNSQLIIEHKEDEIIVPMEDITVILIDHREVILTKEVFVWALKNNVTILFTDEKHQPQSTLIPYHGNTLQTKILPYQSNMTNTTKNRLWKMIIKAKITNQNLVLEKQGVISNKFKGFIKQVELGDKTNIEAQAARMYFSLIYGNDFRRLQDGKDPTNIYLNYTYAIIRGMIARSICATGLHPAFGIWHSNQYDPMPLASDLMEPIRPIVDSYIKDYIKKKDINKLTFDKSDREYLIKIINEVCLIIDKTTILDNAIPMYISSFKNIVCEEGKPFLKLPKIIL